MMRYRTKLHSTCVVCFFVTFVFCCKYAIVQEVGQVKVKTTPSTVFEAHSLAPYKHVTKSLAELGKMDEISGHVLFLNRVPKSGSEILVVLLKWLQGWNTFKHVRLKGNTQHLTNVEQENLVDEAYEIIRTEAVPLTIDRDVHFVNFTKFDKQSPTYINLIRDPADYLISRFHHQIYMSKKRTATKLRTTANIEDCITKKHIYCDLHSGKAYDLAIPYFCGQDARCALLNNEWALDRAKSNVEKYFSVVGILEEVNATLEVFENRLPYFFRGVQKLYYKDLLQPYHQNRSKLPKASEKFRKHIKTTLSKEYAFYEWIKSRLFSQLQIIYGEHNGH